MKTVLNLFRKAFGWSLFVWFAMFVLWNGVVGYYTEISPRNIQNIETVLVALDVLGILLKIWFLGYLFCVAGRVAKDVQKPLRPLDFKKSFIMGIRVVFRLLVLSLPLVAVILIGLWLDAQKGISFGFYYSLFYVVCLIVPFSLFFVANIERFPIFDDVWPFLRKNADNCFAFVVCSAFSYVVWFNIAEAIYREGQIYSTSLARLAIFAYVPYFLLFYTLFFDAVLLGYFAGKTKRMPGEIVVKEAVVEEKKETVKKVSSSNKKKIHQKKVTKSSKSKKTKK